MIADVEKENQEFEVVTNSFLHPLSPCTVLLALRLQRHMDQETQTPILPSPVRLPKWAEWRRIYCIVGSSNSLRIIRHETVIFVPLDDSEHQVALDLHLYSSHCLPVVYDVCTCTCKYNMNIITYITILFYSILKYNVISYDIIISLYHYIII